MRLFLLVALLFVCANAQSEQAAKTEKPANTAKQEQYGTETRPLSVKIISTNKTPEDAKQEQIDREKKEAADKRLGDLTEDLANSTSALVIIGCIQFAVFLLQLFAFIRQAIYMRNSLKIARDGSIIANKPAIRIKHIFLQSAIWEKQKIKLELAIVNTGINSARIIECNVATLILNSKKELPQVPVFPPTEYGPIERPLPSGTTLVFPNHWYGKELDDADNASIRNGTNRLYCFGYVDYHDFTGMIKRKISFCRVLKVPGNYPGSLSDNGRFIKLEEENTDYEYED